MTRNSSLVKSCPLPDGYGPDSAMPSGMTADRTGLTAENWKAPSVIMKQFWNAPERPEMPFPCQPLAFWQSPARIALEHAE